MTGDGERPASDHAARQMIAAFVAALMSERENRIDERAGTLASSLSEQVVRVHLALALHIDDRWPFEFVAVTKGVADRIRHVDPSRLTVRLHSARDVHGVAP